MNPFLTSIRSSSEAVANPTSPSSSNSPTAAPGLSAGAAVAITISVITVVGLGVAVALYFIRRRKHAGLGVPFAGSKDVRKTGGSIAGESPNKCKGANAELHFSSGA